MSFRISRPAAARTRTLFAALCAGVAALVAGCDSAPATSPLPSQQASSAPAQPASINRPLLVDGTGLSFDREGRLWICDYRSDRVSVFGAMALTHRRPKPLVTVTQPSWGPNRLTAAPDGTQWIAAYDDGLITQVDANAAPVGQGIDLGVEQPTGMAFDRRGNLFVTARTSKALLVVDRQDLRSGDGRPAVVKPRRIPAGTLRSSLQDVDVDADGRVWVADYGASQLVELRHARVVKRVDLPDAPIGVTVGPDGRIWMALYSSGLIVAVDPATGDLVTKLSFRDLLQPHEIGFDRRGAMLVSGNGDHILRFPRRQLGPGRRMVTPAVITPVGG